MKLSDSDIIILIEKAHWRSFYYSERHKKYEHVHQGEINELHTWYRNNDIAFKPTTWILDNLDFKLLDIDTELNLPETLMVTPTQIGPGNYLSIIQKEKLNDYFNQLGLVEYSAKSILSLELIRASTLLDKFDDQIIAGQYYTVCSQGHILGIYCCDNFDSINQFKRYVNEKYYLSENTPVNEIPSVSFTDLLGTWPLNDSAQLGHTHLELHLPNINARKLRSQHKRFIQLVFAWMTLAILLTLGYSGYLNYQLNSSQASLGNEWEKYQSIQNELLDLNQKNSTWIELKSKRSATTKIFTELSNTMAEKTWIEVIKYSDNNQLIIQGYSHDESHIQAWMKNLEKSSIFKHVLLKYTELISRSRVKRKIGLQQSKKPLFKFLIEVDL